MAHENALNLADAALAGSRFTAVDLSGTVFEDVNLKGAAFSNVALAGATFRDVDLSGVEIVDARLDGLRIDGVAVTELFRAWRQLQAAGQPPARP